MLDVKQLIQEADQMMQAARKESNRAEEDAITHTVCFQSRQSLINYLTAYLLQQQVKPQQPATMAGLLEQCRSLDGRFQLLDLSNIHCRFESYHQEYCLDNAQVDHCLEVAEQARGLVMDVAPGY
jgi:hypothetical protein